MNQELTVSAKLPVYLYREQLSNMFNRNRELIEAISMNYLCIDEQKEYIRQLMASFDEIDNSAPVKRQLEAILLDLFTKRGRHKPLKAEYSEINLCKASKDKIYVAPDKSDSELAAIAEQNPKLKVCSAGNIFEVVPPLPHEIELVKGNQYDLVRLFAPYAKGSKTLGLIDPYIYNQSALANFKALATRTVYEKITIKCNPADQLKGKDGKPVSTLQFDNLIGELRGKGSEVEILYFDRIRHKERFVLYDDVQVYIPGGLDMFDPSGVFLNDGEGFYLKFNKRKIRF